MPILSGTGGLVEPVDNAQPLYEEAVRQFLAQAERAPPASGFTGCLNILIIAGHERVSYWSPCWDAGATGPMSLTNTHDPETAEASLAETISHLSSDRLRDAMRRLDGSLERSDAGDQRGEGAARQGAALTLR